MAVEARDDRDLALLGDYAESLHMHGILKTSHDDEECLDDTNERPDKHKVMKKRVSFDSQSDSFEACSVPLTGMGPSDRPLGGDTPTAVQSEDYPDAWAPHTLQAPQDMATDGSSETVHDITELIAELGQCTRLEINADQMSPPVSESFKPDFTPSDTQSGSCSEKHLQSNEGAETVVDRVESTISETRVSHRTQNNAVFNTGMVQGAGLVKEADLFITEDISDEELDDDDPDDEEDNEEIASKWRNERDFVHEKVLHWQTHSVISEDEKTKEHDSKTHPIVVQEDDRLETKENIGDEYFEILEEGQPVQSDLTVESEKHLKPSLEQDVNCGQPVLSASDPAVVESLQDEIKLPVEHASGKVEQETSFQAAQTAIHDDEVRGMDGKEGMERTEHIVPETSQFSYGEQQAPTEQGKDEPLEVDTGETGGEMIGTAAEDFADMRDDEGRCTETADTGREGSSQPLNQGKVETGTGHEEEDEDYTSQLVEVQAMMTSFSRRVSCDIDRCHGDVISAIDALVDKMAQEMQSGTLSAAEIMQELSTLTSQNPRLQRHVDSETRALSREATELSETIEPPSRDQHASQSNDQPLQEGSGSTDEVPIANRDQLEQEIYDILDEIMALLGAVTTGKPLPQSQTPPEVKTLSESFEDETAGENIPHVDRKKPHQDGINVVERREILEAVDDLYIVEDDVESHSKVPNNTPMSSSLVEADTDLFITEALHSERKTDESTIETGGQDRPQEMEVSEEFRHDASSIEEVAGDSGEESVETIVSEDCERSDLFIVESEIGKETETTVDDSPDSTVISTDFSSEQASGHEEKPCELVEEKADPETPDMSDSIGVAETFASELADSIIHIATSLSFSRHEDVREAETLSTLIAEAKDGVTHKELTEVAQTHDNTDVKTSHSEVERSCLHSQQLLQSFEAQKQGSVETSTSRNGEPQSLDEKPSKSPTERYDMCDPFAKAEGEMELIPAVVIVEDVEASPDIEVVPVGFDSDNTHLTASTASSMMYQSASDTWLNEVEDSEHIASGERFEIIGLPESVLFSFENTSSESEEEDDNDEMTFVSRKNTGNTGASSVPRDQEDSVLFRLQTLYYVDEHGNRLLTGEETEQHAEIIPAETPTGTVIASDVPEESQRDEPICADSSLANGHHNAMQEDQSDQDPIVTVAEDVSEDLFDEDQADELAENLVNEVLERQEKETALAKVFDMGLLTLSLQSEESVLKSEFNSDKETIIEAESDSDRMSSFVPTVQDDVFDQGTSKSQSGTDPEKLAETQKTVLAQGDMLTMDETRLQHKSSTQNESPTNTLVVEDADTDRQEKEDSATLEESSIEESTESLYDSAIKGIVVEDEHKQLQTGQEELLTNKDTMLQEHNIAQDDPVTEKDMLAQYATESQADTKVHSAAHEDAVVQNDAVAQGDVETEDNIVSHEDAVAQEYSDTSPNEVTLEEEDTKAQDDVSSHGNTGSREDITCQNATLTEKDVIEEVAAARATQEKTVPGESELQQENIGGRDDSWAHKDPTSLRIGVIQEDNASPSCILAPETGMGVAQVDSLKQDDSVSREVAVPKRSVEDSEDAQEATVAEDTSGSEDDIFAKGSILLLSEGAPQSEITSGKEIRAKENIPQKASKESFSSDEYQQRLENQQDGRETENEIHNDDDGPENMKKEPEQTKGEKTDDKDGDVEKPNRDRTEDEGEDREDRDEEEEEEEEEDDDDDDDEEEDEEEDEDDDEEYTEDEEEEEDDDDEEEDEEEEEDDEDEEEDDEDSEFEDPQYQDRLRDEVASAISREIVLMAEVEVAMEDANQSLISPSVEESRVTDFAHPQESESDLKSKELTSGTNKKSEHLLVEMDSSDLGAEGKSVASSSEEPFQITSETSDNSRPSQKKKRIPSLYERSMSAQLTRLVSDDPSKWRSSFEEMQMDDHIFGDEETQQMDFEIIAQSLEEETDRAEEQSSLAAEFGDFVHIQSQGMKEKEDPSTGESPEAGSEERESPQGRQKRIHSVSWSKRRRLQRKRHKQLLKENGHDPNGHDEQPAGDGADFRPKKNTFVEISQDGGDGDDGERKKKKKKKKKTKKAESQSGESAEKDTMGTIPKEVGDKEVPAKKKKKPRKMKTQAESVATVLSEQMEAKEENQFKEPIGAPESETSNRTMPEHERGRQTQRSAVTSSATPPIPDVQITCEDEDHNARVVSTMAPESSLLEKKESPTIPCLQISEPEQLTVSGRRLKSRSRSKSPGDRSQGHLSAPGEQGARARSKSPSLRRITGQPQRRKPRKNIITVQNPKPF